MPVFKLQRLCVMKNHIKNSNKQKGFTLLEVLIALLILAIGILGIAALQFQALRFNHDSYLRTQISITAAEIIDQIRLNSANAGDYVDNYIIGDATGACDLTIAANAANDLACWRQQLIRVLPAGSKANIVSAVTANGTEYTVNMIWEDRENPGNPRTISFTFQP